jgi:hypothetical protein
MSNEKETTVTEQKPAEPAAPAPGTEKTTTITTEKPAEGGK